MNQYLRILIVDDEADCRETYKMLLESKEYAAAAAGDLQYHPIGYYNAGHEWSDILTGGEETIC